VMRRWVHHDPSRQQSLQKVLQAVRLSLVPMPVRRWFVWLSKLPRQGWQGTRRVTAAGN
jgi:hypothetical protein